MSDPQLEVLQGIWQSIKDLDKSLNTRIDGLEHALSHRIDHTNSRLDQTNSRLDQTNARLEEAIERLEHLETEATQSREMNMRILTEILEVAKTNQGFGEVLKQHGARLTRLEAELGLISKT